MTISNFAQALAAFALNYLQEAILMTHETVDSNIW